MSPTERLAALKTKIRHDPETGCWIWLGSKNRYGYGGAKWNGTSIMAHRVFYYLLVGDIAPDLEIDHLCRVRNCVNPAHLEAVSHGENLKRKFEALGCSNGHPFTTESRQIIRPTKGNPYRRCKICERARQLKYKACS